MPDPGADIRDLSSPILNHAKSCSAVFGRTGRRFTEPLVKTSFFEHTSMMFDCFVLLPILFI